jgi:hypothetical protein
MAAAQTQERVTTIGRFPTTGLRDIADRQAAMAAMDGGPPKAMIFRLQSSLFLY